MAEPPVVALFGATALGKSEVAIALADRLGAEIVVADSMQVYAGLPILTNQPDARQRARARHHLVGFVPPQADYTVAEYARAAHAAIDGLLAAGRPVVVEGGSGLYLRAALGDLDFWAPPDPALRRALEERWALDPNDVLDELRRLDEATWAGIDLANPRRIVRALEAVRVTGRPLSADDSNRLWQKGERYAHRLIALEPAEGREALGRRVDERVDWMLANGALEEVASALRAGPFARTVMQAIGVKELVACMEATSTLAEAGTSMKRRTRALVRRQLTWMRKLPEPASVPSGVAPEETAEAILSIIEGRHGKMLAQREGYRQGA